MKKDSQWKKVESVMRKNNGVATLGFLYNHVDVSDWKTQTPFASIRRIVQVNDRFFKIKPGLWGLSERKNEIVEKFGIPKSERIKSDNFSHSYFQGILVEIGNMKGYSTFVPNQDKNKRFLAKSLKEVTSLDIIHQFTFPEIVRKAKTIDTIWFNERNMPTAFFEVEHTTDINNSLIKFCELQDFNSKFNIVGNIVRKREFESKINAKAFNDIKHRVKFISYEQISEIHTSMCKYSSLNKQVIF